MARTSADNQDTIYQPDQSERGQYRLHKSAEACYNKLAEQRINVEENAEELAEITDPTIFLPRDYIEGDWLYVPNQSINSGAVDNWANVLTYTAFPPGLPMFVHNILVANLSAEEAADPELISKTKQALVEIEKLHRERFEATTLRNSYVTLLTLLCVTGNALWRQLNVNHPTIHSMRNYVVQRDNLGRPMYTILKESVPFSSLDEETRVIVENQRRSGRRINSNRKDMDLVDVFSVLKQEYRPIHKTKKGTEDEGDWFYWQELEGGAVLEGTEENGAEGSGKPPPMYPAWLNPRPGFNWGTGYCEKFRGDLFQIENDHHALNDGSAISSWMLALVDPAGPTRIESVREADNLDTIPGRAADVTFLTTQKQGDWNVVASHADSAQRRVERAFFMMAAIQRQAERVTKEEIVRMAQDLDKASGGLHTLLSQTVQRYVIQRNVYLHEIENSNLPKAPKEIVRLGVVTGVDSLGRDIEYGNLMDVSKDLSTVLTPEGYLSHIEPNDLIRRAFTGKSIRPQGLVKDPEKMAQEAEQQKQDQLMQETAPGVATALAREGGGAMRDMAGAAMEQPPM